MTAPDKEREMSERERDVERVRNAIAAIPGGRREVMDLCEAAEILATNTEALAAERDRLQAEVARLVAALQEADCLYGGQPDPKHCDCQICTTLWDSL
jgi:hypothetical protein